jgi:hypothetical protein
MAFPQSSPYATVGAFSVSLSEGDYTPAQFGATIASFTAPTTGPCWAITMNAAQNVASFTPVNATALSSSPFADPCLIPSGDVESVRFTDENGHSNTQWFERVGSTGNPNTLTEFYFGLNGPAAPAPPATEPPLVTSASAGMQQAVDSGPGTLTSFSVSVLSSISAGPFKAVSVYWTASTSASCLAIAPASPSPNGVFTFTLATPPPIGGGAGSPCLSTADTEEVLFSDSFGNSNVQFFKL